MTISNVAIANMALQKLGEGRIESLSQDKAAAREMNAVFEIVRDAELRRYDWGFATKRASIAADASQTAWGDWNRFSLPNDCLRIIRDDESGFSVDWKIEAGDTGEGVFIVTQDSAPLYIKYIARIEDPTYFDSLFIEALAAKLAFQTCKRITGSTGAQQMCQADYNMAIAEARRTGAIEKPAQDAPEDSWITVRF